MLGDARCDDQRLNTWKLDAQDYREIDKMFAVDFERAANFWNREHDQKQRDYGLFFADIVEKFGFTKFERFLSLISTMKRFESADHGMNCATVAEFNNVNFENFTFFGLLFGRAQLGICIDYFEDGHSELDVGLQIPHPFVP